MRIRTGDAQEEQADRKKAMLSLLQTITDRAGAGTPVDYDVAVHAAMLVKNGWRPDKALEESQRALDDAAIEGGF